MINDDSELVRIEALRTLICIAQDYTVTADDLSIMLMCLKDTRIQFRYYVYRLAAIVSISSEAGFLDFIDRLIKTLKTYKEDKVYLYRALRGIGSRCKELILPNVKTILDVADLEDQHEPNWKNILYKARIVLIANCFSEQYYEGLRSHSSQLPPYFLKHFEYIRDVEPYAFQKPLKGSLSLSDFSHYDLSSKRSRVQFLRANISLWKGLQVDEELAVAGQPTEERFLKKIFSTAVLVYELEGVLDEGRTLFEVRFDSVAKKLLHKILKI